jgi:hypothetical protein
MRLPALALVPVSIGSRRGDTPAERGGSMRFGILGPLSIVDDGAEVVITRVV